MSTLGARLQGAIDGVAAGIIALLRERNKRRAVFMRQMF